VVPTLDVVARDGELFLVMDYVQGESLARLVRASSAKHQSIPLDVVSAIICGVLHGLHAAHEATDDHGDPLEIVHRDVSPHNVLVGADGIARVLDFGVAKAAGRIHTTRDGQVKGKLAYMAPEQLRARGLDRRTDVFAAGIVLWELLTLERLFGDTSEEIVVTNVLERPIPRPSTIAGGLSKEAEDVMMHALALAGGIVGAAVAGWHTRALSRASSTPVGSPPSSASGLLPSEVQPVPPTASAPAPLACSSVVLSASAPDTRPPRAAPTSNRPCAIKSYFDESGIKHFVKVCK
jgi:serine/threonine protein kinase